VTPVEANKLVTLIVVAYPTQTHRWDAAHVRATADVYCRALADISFERAKAAVERLVCTSRFVPTIADIRAAAIETTHGRRRAGGDAWGEVVRKIGRYGYLRTPGVDFQFDDPVVAEAVKGLGWRSLCESENAVADRARFVELYDQLAADARIEAAASPGASSPVLPDLATDALPSPPRGDVRSLDSLLGNVLARRSSLPS
jgi:nucleoside-diphosphate-sugar epimerase